MITVINCRLSLHLTIAMVQIIYINGPSSVGKTTVAKSLQQMLREYPWLHFGLDRMIGLMPTWVNNFEETTPCEGFSWKTHVDEHGMLVYDIRIGPFAERILTLYRIMTVTMAQDQFSIIIDDVAFHGNIDIQQWRSMLAPFSVLWVGLTAPREVLIERERKRKNRTIGSAEEQLKVVHTDVVYDLFFDTSQLTAEDIAYRIHAHITR